MKRLTLIIICAVALAVIFTSDALAGGRFYFKFNGGQGYCAPRSLHGAFGHRRIIRQPRPLRHLLGGIPGGYWTLVWVPLHYDSWGGYVPGHWQRVYVPRGWIRY